MRRLNPISHRFHIHSLTNHLYSFSTSNPTRKKCGMLEKNVNLSMYGSLNRKLWLAVQASRFLSDYMTEMYCL